MTILVTGAAGFLGRHVVDVLVRRGHRVRAMIRPSKRSTAVSWPDRVEPFEADLRSSRNLDRAFDDVTCVVHLAAVVSGGEDAQFAGTVAGTERLLAAMHTSACRHIVLCGSFSVYDFSATAETLDETSPLHAVPAVYQRDGYTVAKWWQERVVRREAEAAGWALTVLRPGFIWGRDHSDMSALGERIGPLHLVIGPKTRLPLTYVENCADVFARAVDDPRARDHTFNVVDDEGPTIWRYLADHRQGTAASGWRLPVPYRIARAAVGVAKATVFRRASKLPSVLMPERFESRLKPLRFDNTKLRTTLAWSPPLSYAACLAQTYGSQRDDARLALAPSRQSASRPGE